MTSQFNPKTLKQIYQPPLDSHKGQNGRLLVIGGSRLFHASIFWSADVASKIVDLVHFTSPAMENNELVRKKAKEGFWNGIVVDFAEVENYVEEDDCVLIGPGMSRVEDPENSNAKFQMPNEYQNQNDKPRQDMLETAALYDDTRTVVNMLLARYPEKKWVVDGGALQEVDPELLNGNMIITPHLGEWERLVQKEEILRQSGTAHSARFAQDDKLDLKSLSSLSNEKRTNQVADFSKTHGGVTVLLKGREDIVCRGEEYVMVEGGNAGMTKGGTGDVLAGLVAALYCKNDAYLAAQAGSYVCKKAGESLSERVGVYFGAGDLVGEVPRVLGGLVS